jgi:hypothetical protein
MIIKWIEAKLIESVHHAEPLWLVFISPLASTANEKLTQPMLPTVKAAERT